MEEQHNKGIKEIEATLQEIGNKIEELVKKGASVGQDMKEEIEKKIRDLKENKTTLEDELRKAKKVLEQEYQEKKKEYEPKLKESKGFLLEAFKQLGFAFEALFGKKS